MIILLIIFPLFGFFAGILFGRYLGVGVLYISTLLMSFSLILSLYLFFLVGFNGCSLKLIVGSWILVDSLHIEWSFLIDSLTAVMLVVVTLISTLVHLYSTEYMEKDPHILRFMSYLSLFTFFMLILITANNFLQMFVGWEGVGVSSFLLINFWFTRIQANKSAIKAMLVNRVGDFFILLALFNLNLIFNTLDYDVIFNLSKTFADTWIFFCFLNINSMDLICLLLFLGAMGKSAQIGLHVWLPDAMEGPTPVSALIHAATMVTAGVFLIARCSFLFELSPFVLNFIIFIGALTAFFASTTGLFQNDIKKVIAYSTCSQLGYMVFACGLSSYHVGIFHLFNHAFFKALLFLGAGSIIHALSNEQDMRKMGGLKNLLPFSYSVIFIGSLALVGFPFLSGFYSKDTILELSFATHTNMSYFSYILGVLGAFCTSFYSTRLLFLVFLSKPNGNKIVIKNSHEGSWKLGLPLFILIFFSVFIGFLTKDLFIGFGTNFWGSSIYILGEQIFFSDIEFIPVFLKILPLLVTLLGSLLAFLFYAFSTQTLFAYKINKKYKTIYTFLNKKWYFDRIYNSIISQSTFFGAYTISYKEIDRGILEKFGPYGLVLVLIKAFEKLKGIQSGNIFHYLFIFILFIILICFIFLYF